MKILLLSAYDAQSHRYWREGLAEAFSQHHNDIQWAVLALPPRYFNWRIRGNALSWTQQEQEVLRQDYDLIVATSMVDLVGLKGLNTKLSHVPSVVYFHENQFFYPNNSVQQQRIEPQFMTIYTAITADKIVFNSQFNRATFLTGAKELLTKMPDQLNASDVIAQLESKSSVLVVPLKGLSAKAVNAREANTSTSAQEQVKGAHLVWNHRWEHDKAPERLLALVQVLLVQEFEFSLSVLGQKFRQQPAALDDLHTLLKREKPDALLHWGYVESAQDYRNILSSADIVLSTALHDFQGIAVLEAVALGCVPLLPNRVVYPDIFPLTCCYEVSEEAEVEAQSAFKTLQFLTDSKYGQSDEFSNVKAGITHTYSWTHCAPQYLELFEETSKLRV